MRVQQSGGGWTRRPILYKSEWTSAATVEAFLGRHAGGRIRRPKTGTVGPYLTEQVEYRDLDREAFYEQLHRNGSHAYDEFKRAGDIWRQFEEASPVIVRDHQTQRVVVP